jgi:hypothetical protein
LLSHSQFPNSLLQSGLEISLNVVVYVEFNSDNLPVMRIIVDFDAILTSREDKHVCIMTSFNNGHFLFFPFDLLYFLRYGPDSCVSYIYLFIYSWGISNEGLVAYLLNSVLS